MDMHIRVLHGEPYTRDGRWYSDLVWADGPVTAEYDLPTLATLDLTDALERAALRTDALHRPTSEETPA